MLTYLFTYLHAYLLTCLLTYLLACLLTYLLAYLLTCLLAYLLTYLLTCLLTYMLAYLLTYLPAYLLAFWLVYLLTYLLTCLLTYLLTYLLACLLTYLLTYSLTPYSTVLLEKLTRFQLVKKFPTFYGTRRFLIAFASARHLSLSWASSIQSITPTPKFLKIHLRLYQSISPGPRLTLWLFRNRTTPCRLSATAYSIYSQLPSALVAVPPTATWGRPIPWWQGHYYKDI